MSFTPVAIVAIICWAIVELANTKYKKRNTMTQGEVEKMTKALKDLQDRVATLEKIVTDEKYNLKKEIDSL